MSVILSARSSAQVKKTGTRFRILDSSSATSFSLTVRKNSRGSRTGGAGAVSGGAVALVVASCGDGADDDGVATAADAPGLSAWEVRC